MKKTISMFVASALAISAAIPVFAADTFKDVSETGAYNWSYQYVEDIAANGFISGYEDGTFRPGKSVSRLEAFALFARLMGSNNEANADVVEAAKENYKDILSKYSLSYAEGDVAFMLSRGVLKEDELDTYFKDDKKSEAMPRYEAAILITKAMSAEEEATAEVLIDLDYVDVADIPKNARQHVYYVSQKGIMSGMGAGEFSPNTSVLRSQIAVMMSKTVGTVKYDFEATALISVDAAKNNIKIKDFDDEIGYDKDTKFFKNGVVATENDMRAGQRVVLTYSEDDEAVRLVSVDIIEDEIDSSVSGIYRGVKSASGDLLVTLEDATTGKATEYNCNSNATILINNMLKNIRDLAIGDYVKLNIADDEVVEIIYMEKKTSIADAAIEAISPIGTITISHGSEQFDGQTYTISNDVLIIKNGDTETFADLYKGDTVNLTLEYGVITRIVAKSKIGTITGNLTSFTISAAPSLTIKKDGEEYTYDIPSNVVIKHNGEAVKLPELKIGALVTLTIESDVVKEISSSESGTVTAGDSITGTVTAVNASANVIIVSYEEGGSETTAYITCNNNTKYYVVPTLSEYSLKQIKVGDLIVAYGDRSTGIFICSGVTVSPAK